MFSLRDESDDDNIQVLCIGIPSDDDEDDDKVEYISNVVVRIQAPRNFLEKVLLKEERRIWSVVLWP